MGCNCNNTNNCDCTTVVQIGQDGDNGWSPILAVVSDGERRVLQLVDWAGGTGIKPTFNVNEYIGPTGFEVDIANGTDIRGAAGAGGAGQSIDHVAFLSSTGGGGAGVAGETDTYTVWGDAGETIDLGTFLVTNGIDGAGGTDELVKASATDTTPGFLDAKVKNSVEVDSEKIQLVNDELAPGNSLYYGTDAGGAKGYHGLPTVTTDELVKASAGDTAGFLDAKVDKSIVVVSNKLELKGDVDVPANNKYYGTDNLGTKGYHDLISIPFFLVESLSTAVSFSTSFSQIGGISKTIGAGEAGTYVVDYTGNCEFQGDDREAHVEAAIFLGVIQLNSLCIQKVEITPETGGQELRDCISRLHCRTIITVIEADIINAKARVGSLLSQTVTVSDSLMTMIKLS